ncbi:MAG: hypothetical protein GPJ27_11500 [Microcystis aeruginosa L111-01]|jgi:hypothetical protein|nr:hypothetical protein [Microcystis aeruginosa L111-01]NCS52569.1 hypothetical protein [Microcystis aeruginosa G13-05]
MSPTFTPIRLTIIDFLGVFLPGMVWTVLFFTLREMVSPQWNIKPTDPLKVAFFIATLPKELSGHEYGAPFYVGLALLSILIGYFNMALSTYPAEWISIRVSSFIRNIICLFNCPCKKKFRRQYMSSPITIITKKNPNFSIQVSKKLSMQSCKFRKNQTMLR